MNGSNICGYPLYVCLLLCICFNLINFGFKFENKFKKVFFNLDTVKKGGQITKIASNVLTKAVWLRQLPLLIVLTKAVPLQRPPRLRPRLTVTFAPRRLACPPRLKIL